tara:strand:+ start:723 stop:2348 length:1626 start_codon:yes stop_codon:yes gene_type:complete
MTVSAISFIFFTALVAIICYWKTRNDKMETADDYFLGGRTLTAWVIAGSLMLTNLSTEHLIGLNGDAFNHTIAIMAWETTAALAMVVAAIYFLPKYLKIGLTTIPEYLEDRYDQTTRTIATCLFLFSYVIAILPVVLLFGATGIESLFDVSETFNLTKTQSTWMIVWGVGTIGSLYAIFGGLKAVAISDTINGVGFLIAGLMVPALALMAIGDGDILAGLGEVYTKENAKFDITGDEPGSFLPFGVLFTGMIINQIFFWCTNQSIIQRSLGAKNLAEGQKGVLIAAIFKLICPLIIVLPGVIAFHMFKDQLGPEDYLMAYPMLVKSVLPPVFIGFFAAVMVGAVLSTFNSVLNSSATLFSQGIYQSLFNRQATGRQMIFSGRLCSIILALLAMVMAPLIDSEGSLYNYLQKINATFFGPMLAVIMLGLLTKKVSAQAAKLGMIIGPILFYLLVFVFNDSIQSILKNMFSTQDDIHFLHFLAVVFVVTVIIMAIVSYFKPAEIKPTKITKPPPVDITPWKYTNLVGGLVSITTVACYILLAQ